MKRATSRLARVTCYIAAIP